MINIKSPHEIECMRKSGAILRDCLLFLGDRVKPGVSTKRLDEFAYDYIKRHDSTPSFLGYGGFPGTICASIDEVVVHGFPSDRRLKEGEIIGVDCGLVFKGWQADAARTFLVGEVSDEKKRLVDTTRESFSRASSSSRQADDWEIYPTPCRFTTNRADTESSGLWSDTESAEKCTRIPLCRITAKQDTVRNSK